MKNDRDPTLESMERNFMMTGTIFGKNLPGVWWYIEEGGCLQFATGVQGCWLNRVTSYDLPVDHVHSTVASITQRYKKLPVLPDWVVSPAQPNSSTLLPALVANGWIEYGRFVGMQNDSVPAPIYDTNRFTLQQVNTTEALDVWLGIFFEGFSLQTDCLEFVRKLYGRSSQDSSFGLDSYLLFDTGVPVCCACLHRSNGLTMFYNVTTRTASRKQGAATAMMGALMKLIRDRESGPLCLYSQSEEVCTFYERLGFRRCDTEVIFYYLPVGLGSTSA